MKKIAIIAAVMLPLLFANINCKTVKSLFGKKEIRKTDSVATIEVHRDITSIDTSKIKADVQKKKITKESYSENNIVIQIPTKKEDGKTAAPLIVNVGADLKLDSTSTLDTIKFRSQSNPDDGLDIYKNPANPKEAVVRIAKNGSDTVVPFTTISISHKNYNRETTEDVDSAGESIAGKIIQNTIDSNGDIVVKSTVSTNEQTKDVKRDSWPLVWWGVAAVAIISLLIFLYFKLK